MRVRRLTHVYGWVTASTLWRREQIGPALIRALMISIITATLGFLWKAALPNGATIAGYDAVQITWYVAIAEAAVTAVNPRMMVRVGESLKNGELTMELLRPASAAAMLVAREIGVSLACAYVALPCTLGVAWLVAGPPPSITGLVLALICMAPAVVANVAFVVAASAAALWMGETTAMWMVVQKTVFVAGGMLIPLETWPGRVGDVLAVLPFAAMAYTPAHLGVLPELGVAVRLICLQVLWIAVLGGCVALVWSRGLRRIIRVAA